MGDTRAPFPVADRWRDGTEIVWYAGPTASARMREKGRCGWLSPSGDYVCVKADGHTGNCHTVHRLDLSEVEAIAAMLDESEEATA